MSIFIKAGLWIEKQVGYKGELNLTRFVTDLIFANPSSPTVIETDGVFNGTSVFTNNTYGIPQTDSTGLVSITPMKLNDYYINNYNFINYQVSSIKINEETINSFYSNIAIGYTLEFPNLKYIINELSNTGITSVSLPMLIYANSLRFNENHNLTSIDLPALANANNVQITNNTLMSSVNLPSLVTSNYFNVESNESLVSVNLPLLSNVTQDLSILNNPLLTSISFPSLTSVTELNLFNCALTEETVDNVLAKLVSIPTFTGVDCYLNLDGGTNSPPSAAGLLNVAILEARGCTVTYN